MNVACAEAPHFAVHHHPELAGRALSIRPQNTDEPPMAMNMTLDDCYRKCVGNSSVPSVAPLLFSYGQADDGTCCQCPFQTCTALGSVVNRWVRRRIHSGETFA